MCEWTPSTIHKIKCNSMPLEGGKQDGEFKGHPTTKNRGEKNVFRGKKIKKYIYSPLTKTRKSNVSWRCRRSMTSWNVSIFSQTPSEMIWGGPVFAETGNIPKTCIRRWRCRKRFVLISRKEKELDIHTMCVAVKGCCCTQRLHTGYYYITYYC